MALRDEMEGSISISSVRVGAGGSEGLRFADPGSRIRNYFDVVGVDVVVEKGGLWDG